MTPLKSTLLPFLVVLATITTQVTTYASPLSYDARGLLAARSSVAFDVRTDTPAAPGNPPVAPTTGPHQLGHFLYDHDEVGRNVRLSYPDGHARVQTWDERGRLTSRCYAYAPPAETRCYTAEYDEVGNPVRLGDPEGETLVVYDDLDRVVEVLRGPEGGPHVSEERYEYNALGGFSFFRTRTWSPELGAFLQPDGFEYLEGAGTLWSWPGQNPYRWRDPLGTDAVSDLQSALDRITALPGGMLVTGGLSLFGHGVRNRTDGTLMLANDATVDAGLALRSKGNCQLALGAQLTAANADVLAGVALLPRGLAGVGDLARSITPSSRALGQALDADGFARPAGSVAHHIVAGRAAAAEPARAVLQRFGIGINETANGVFLPASLAAPNAVGAAVHSTLHTRSYYQAVNAALRRASTREEALEVLNDLRQSLLSGGLR